MLQVRSKKYNGSFQFEVLPDSQDEYTMIQTLQKVHTQ